MKRHGNTAVGLLAAGSLLATGLLLGSVSPTGAANDGANKPTTLNELLSTVRNGWERERGENRDRENNFARDRDRQQRLLNASRNELARLEAQSEKLEAEFETNEQRIVQLESTLADRLGTLGEAFGTVRQVAGDTRGHLEQSITSAQISGRDEFLGKLASSRKLPQAEALEKLWYALQQEMTEQGQVVRFSAPVLGSDGQQREREVLRVGTFNVLSDGRYLQWLPEVKRLAELGRQPASRHLSTVSRFERAESGSATLALDPSRGVLLSLLVQTPSAGERIAQGRAVGVVILLLGAAGAVLGLWRLFIVLAEDRRVRAQQKSRDASTDNSLGRVLSVADANHDADVESLELLLDEAILKETTTLDRYLWVVRTVSVVAPLLGLLGTVTGMIRTFQAITLFGTGDPRLMAGGISEALVTTMLGLCVAIPLLLLHALVTSGARRINDVLDQQAAGMVVLRSQRGADDG